MVARTLVRSACSACSSSLQRFVGVDVDQRVLRHLAVELRNLLLARAGARFLQADGGLDGARPFLLALEDLQQRAARLHAVRGIDQALEGFLGAVQQAGLQVVHAQFILGVRFLLGRQVRARQQVLVHADGALGLAAAAEQVAQREVHIGRFRVQAHDLDEGVDGLVRLVVQEEVQALEIAARQAARLGHQLADVHPRGDPAQAEENGHAQQPPEFEFHTFLRIIVAC